MNRKNRAQSSTLFLLELILAILFFSLASAVCVQLFVKSHLLSRNAQNLNYAVNECSGIAEILASSEGMEQALDTIQELYTDADREKEDSSSIFIYYGKDFTPCKAEEAVYILETALSLKDRMLTGDLSMKETSSGNSFYQLSVRHYLQRRDTNG